MAERLKKPEWLKVKLPESDSFQKLDSQISGSLNTICRSARCPNIFECWQKKHATFLLMGNVCTRNCLFCNVGHGKPSGLDPLEGDRIVDFAAGNGLRYLVLTSVTRDDLPDGGSTHFRDVITKLKSAVPNLIVEALIPDFLGRVESFHDILESGVDCVSHNLETVREIYPAINRSPEQYRRSLDLIRYFSGKGMITKSGFMLGLGETREQVSALLADLKTAGALILTIGQYLRPSLENIEVTRYCSPQEFEEWKVLAEEAGFSVASAPLVRSSYRAEQLYREALNEVPDFQ